jgi:hypothetical protein
MTEWFVDIVGFLLLCLGMRLGQPKLLRALCAVGIAYLSIFFVTYYVWLKWKYHYFEAHPEMLHVGISAAFAFEGFSRLLASMVLLQGIIPVGLVFLVYFSIKWLASSARPGSSYF